MNDYRLSKKEIIQLKQEHRQAKTKFEADRLKAVYLLGEGWELKAIAHILDKDERTVLSYFQLYQDGGIGQLLQNNDNGQEPKLTAEQEQQISEHLRNRNYRERKLLEEYQRICEDIKTASTEEDWQFLTKRLRSMTGYKNTADLASLCEDRARKLAKPPGDRVELQIKGVKLPFRRCPAGKFLMGSPAGEMDRGSDEMQHEVTLAIGFWMLETEVTQLMWGSVMENKPSRFHGPKRPVEQVSWNDAQEYIKKLNELNAAPTGYRFSLPTEAQWEYACRAGTTTAYHFGGSLTTKQANFGGSQTRDVGSYPANAWGLRDMHGNVWEWCLDWYGDYPSDAIIDPAGPDKGSARVFRGGSWGDITGLCRSAYRYSFAPSFRGNFLGLRLSLVCKDR